jgi:hypothetical protein
MLGTTVLVLFLKIRSWVLLPKMSRLAEENRRIVYSTVGSESENGEGGSVFNIFLALPLK